MLPTRDEVAYTLYYRVNGILSTRYECHKLHSFLSFDGGIVADDGWRQDEGASRGAMAPSRKCLLTFYGRMTTPSNAPQTAPKTFTIMTAKRRRHLAERSLQHVYYQQYNEESSIPLLEHANDSAKQMALRWIQSRLSNRFVSKPCASLECTRIMT